MEVAEFLVLGTNADGINVFTVSVAPGVAMVAWPCADTDSEMAWLTRDVEPKAFATLTELMRELTA